jgi:anti-anti-sigma regulatory factor
LTNPEIHIVHVHAAASVPTEALPQLVSHSIAAAAPEAPVVVDLTALTSITPRGCDLLIDVIAGAATSREIAVVASSLDVRLELILCGLDQIVPLVHTPEEAASVVRVRVGVCR